MWTMDPIQLVPYTGDFDRGTLPDNVQIDEDRRLTFRRRRCHRRKVYNEPDLSFEDLM